MLAHSGCDLIGSYHSPPPCSNFLSRFSFQNGNTALAIARRLGYISVVDTLKVVTEEVITTTTVSMISRFFTLYSDRPLYSEKIWIMFLSSIYHFYLKGIPSIASNIIPFYSNSEHEHSIVEITA